MKIQIQKLITHCTEYGLTAVIAVGVIGLGVMFALAANTATTTLRITINPAGGNTVTVTAPNGGESWTVDATENITWTSTGSISDVKIELQRATGGAWTTVVASTTDDGSYPWVVTSPTGSQNTIRISEVGDASINDSSDATFTISASGGGGSGGGGGSSVSQLGIDNVTPIVVINNSDAVLDITGINFKSSTKFYLDKIPLINNTWLSSRHMRATVPAGISPGMNILYAYNSDGTYTYWGTLIRIINQSIDGAGVNIPEVIKLYLHSNEVSEMSLKFKNYTNYSWNQDLKLGTVDPYDRSSRFYNPTSWVSNNRVARYAGSSVGYGGEATMNVSFKAPAEVGKYTEKFGLVLEGVEWLNILPVTVQITVIDEDEELPEPPSTGGLPGLYSAKWMRQSSYLQLKPGQTGELWVEFKNTGTSSWYGFGANPVKLGTSRPIDRSSVFKTSSWLSGNRTALVSKPGSSGLGSQVIEPDEIGRFTFVVTAPNTVRKYREYFRPVVEYRQWLPDYGVYWDITVTDSAGTVEPPSTGGSSFLDFFKPISKPESVLTPSQPIPVPSSSSSFSDGIEKVIQTIIGWFNQLWN